MKQCRASIIQTAPQGPDDYQVVISAIDETSGIQFLEVRMTLEEFGRLLHAPTHSTCTVILRGTDKIGWASETKSEIVEIGKIGRPTVEQAAAILAPYEVDGWRGRVSDLQNHHNSAGPTAQRVTFHRFVPPVDGEQPGG